MATSGIDVGAYHHAVAVCRDGMVEAERGVVRIGAPRSGFREFDRFVDAVGTAS